MYTNNCPTQNNYKFEGKERDAEAQNDDFGARYYTWRFGRWLSADWSAVPVPVPYANLSNPQTLNLYSMVADDPETFADLDGHDIAAWINTICPLGFCGFNGSGNGRVNQNPSAQQANSQATADTKKQAAQNQGATQNQSCGFFCKAANWVTGNGWGAGPKPPPPLPPPGPPAALPHFEGTALGSTPHLDSPLRCINQCYKSLSGKNTVVTSTNEDIPQHAPGTPHREGDAADFRYPKGHDNTFLGCASGCGATYARDEKKNRSRLATGDHMHVSVSPRPPGASRGDLPPRD